MLSDLRAQVEERLNFFETGAPPSKNADAMRKAIDKLAAEDAEGSEEDEEMPILPRLEVSPTREKEKKMKRKSDAKDRDEELPTSRKTELTKEEKKALKKLRKEKEAKKRLQPPDDVSFS